MDAKSQAELIYSTADGPMIACPNCGTLNERDYMFCYLCGTPLENPQQEAFEDFDNNSVAEENASEVFSAADSVGIPGQSMPAPAETTAVNPDASIPKVNRWVAPAPKQRETKTFHFAEQVIDEQEPENAFALGLPDWDILPPQTFISRKGVK